MVRKINPWKKSTNLQPDRQNAQSYHGHIHSSDYGLVRAHLNFQRFVCMTKRRLKLQKTNGIFLQSMSIKLQEIVGQDQTQELLNNKITKTNYYL